MTFLCLYQIIQVVLIHKILFKMGMKNFYIFLPTPQLCKRQSPLEVYQSDEVHAFLLLSYIRNAKMK
jgi:hypothetical protein